MQQFVPGKLVLIEKKLEIEIKLKYEQKKNLYNMHVARTFLIIHKYKLHILTKYILYM